MIIDRPIVVFDVQYNDEDRTARVAAVTGGFKDDEVCEVHRCTVTNVAPYESGKFYKRELPCLVRAFGLFVGAAGDQANVDNTILIIDGYVDLGVDHPGLGRYLHEATGLPVIGVAKTAFKSAPAIPIQRGTSKSPLFITAAGLTQLEAADAISLMSGPYRLPTLIKAADSACRGHR